MTASNFTRALFYLALLFGIVMTSCKQEILPIKVESVTLDITSLTMSVGETRSLTATISPSDAENQKVLWSTSNANIMTVKDGAVSALAPGNATVTAKTDDGGKTAECTIIVKEINEDGGSGDEEEDEEDAKEEEKEEGKEEGKEEENWPVTSVLSAVTATTVQFDITLDRNAISEYQEAGLLFSSVDDLDIDHKDVTVFQLNRESSSKGFTGLTYNTKYYYTTYLKKGTFYLYGEKEEFTTSNVHLDLSVASTTTSTAQIIGTVEGLAESDKSLIEVGMIYSSEVGKVENGEGAKLTATEIPSDNAVSFDITELTSGKKYYYCSYVKQGEGYVYGEEKEFTTASATVVTIAEFLASGGSAIEGIVISNSDLNNLTSKKTMYIQDETAGLQFYLESSHPFLFGDKVRVDVAGVSTSKYDGAVQVSGLALDKITKISSGNTVTPKTVTIADFLANKYEGQYIAIEDVEVAHSDLGKTFVLGGAHTSINIEDVNNNKFVVFSSKYATYGTETVPQGSGTIKGISSINKGKMQIIFAQNSDFAGLTGERFGAVDLSTSASANCYIVSESGLYKFKTVKGNGSQSVGAVASAEVLWETFGSSVDPHMGDLVNSVSYKNGDIIFQTADTFKKGNALIAAKNASGKILWSWHIWFTDQPQGQKYSCGDAIMMDCNLGAVSTAYGKGRLGLLYQWGRKDPFLGSLDYTSNIQAKSTITWPSPVASDDNTGTIAYAIANPTTFITDDVDWYCYSSNNTLWTTSDESKSIYDPCPVGWRVPDGGEYGVWAKAFGLGFVFEHPFNAGVMNFSNKFGSDQNIIYYAAGYRSRHDGSLNNVGKVGRYWSATPYYNESLGGPRHGRAYALCFHNGGLVSLAYHNSRAEANSVRCIKE